ncbi:MAG: hypothetical protein IJO75_05735 [Clostridia bacterium]|nr:hypothetical protein [Clostridia bacterium]
MTENTIFQENPATVQAEDTIIEVPVYPESDAVPPPKKRKFLKILSIYFAVLIVLITVALWFFYNHLQAYEAKTPSAALANYLQWIQDGDYEAIYAASDFEETVLNTKEEFFKYLDRLYDGDLSTLSVREKVTSTDERKDYTIYVDNKRVSSLTLIKNPEWGDTTWNYVTEIHYLPPVSIIAADNTRISVNGVDVSLLNLTNKPAHETVWSGMSKTDDLPLVYEYTLENLLNPPTVEALALSGDVCQVAQTSDYVYEVYQPVAETLRTEREELAQDAAFLYAKFVARDAEKNELLKLIHKDSDLYQTIRRFDNQWFTGHYSYEFSDVKISAYSQFTSSDFACEVSFQPKYYVGKGPIDGTPFNCRLMFVQVEDDWKLVALTNIIEDSSDSDTTTDASNTATTTTNTAATNG